MNKLEGGGDRRCPAAAGLQWRLFHPEVLLRAAERMERLRRPR